VEDVVTQGPSANPAAFWRDRPVLVTGATGLLGSAVVESLVRQRAAVVCLIRDWVPDSEFARAGRTNQTTVVRGDVGDGALIERTLGEYEIDTVLHLAAQTIVGVANRNPASTWQTNVAGTWAVLEAARRSPTVKQIVVASSDKAYGESAQLPYVETAPLLGRHPYDASKACADIVAQSYAASFGTPVAITRCGNFFGGGDLNWNRLVPGTIRSVIRGEPPVIRSDGKFVRDYIDVRDGMSAVLILAERLASQPELCGEAFNFSNESRLTVRQIVDTILRLMGSRLVPRVLDVANNEIRHQYLSAEKARSVLGWSPRYSLEQGLADAIAWYRAYFEGKS
jgi:CDP-glucose 4,6-dehydratase